MPAAVRALPVTLPVLRISDEPGTFPAVCSPVFLLLKIPLYFICPAYIIYCIQKNAKIQKILKVSAVHVRIGFMEEDIDGEYSKAGIADDFQY